VRFRCEETLPPDSARALVCGVHVEVGAVPGNAVDDILDGTCAAAVHRGGEDGLYTCRACELEDGEWDVGYGRDRASGATVVPALEGRWVCGDEMVDGESTEVRYFVFCAQPEDTSYDCEVGLFSRLEETKYQRSRKSPFQQDYFVYEDTVTSRKIVDTSQEVRQVFC
jgi:hypothetical protein